MGAARLLSMSLGELAEEVVAEEAGFVAVAEIEADGVVADLFPAGDGHAGELFRAVAAVLVSEDVTFADVGGAGGRGAQVFHQVVGFDAVFPDDGDFRTDELDVGGRFHVAKG